VSHVSSFDQFFSLQHVAGCISKMNTKRSTALVAFLVTGWFPPLGGAFRAACSCSLYSLASSSTSKLAAHPRMTSDPNGGRAAAYFGAGGGMDKRLIKVEAEVQSSLAASSLVLIDGACSTSFCAEEELLRRTCAHGVSPAEPLVVLMEMAGAGDNLRAACGWRVSPEDLAIAIDAWAGDCGAGCWCVSLSYVEAISPVISTSAARFHAVTIF
jgi:hypothetical protein